MPALRIVTRRVLIGGAGLLLVGMIFTAGMLAGAGSTPKPTAAPSAPPAAATDDRPGAAGLLDEAASRIAAEALRPVDRAQLDQAAIDAMLRVTGDQWGSYRSPSLAPGADGSVTVHTEPAHAGDVTRIAVASLHQGAGRQVRTAVDRARSGRTAGILLDLRDNSGGRLDEAVEAASVFLDGGPVVGYTRRGGATQHLQALADGDTGTPLVVLVDGGTASAAEVVAGALQDRGRAVLVGSRTFGKGSVQEPQRLSDGSLLEITVARYTTPSGRSLEGSGLEPDIVVAGGSAPSAAVRRGVEVLTGLLADAGGAR